MALTLRSSCTAVVSLLLFANEGLSRHPLIEGMLSFKSADFSCGVSLVAFDLELYSSFVVLAQKLPCSYFEDMH